MILPAISELILDHNWIKRPFSSLGLLLRGFSRVKVFGYIFSGAMWAGVGFIYLDNNLQLLDALTPINLLFLIWIAFLDASENRKKVFARHQKF